MTLERYPGTVEDALKVVLDLITPKGASEAICATGRKCGENYISAVSHPTRRERLTVEDMITLSVAYEAAGGKGAPLIERVLSLYDIRRAQQFASRAALLECTIDMVREAGEANAAALEAALPGAGPRQRARAEREAHQLHDAVTRWLAESRRQHEAPDTS